MMTEFNEKVALITGSSSGIGEAIAIKLSKLGASVVITGRDETKIATVVQKCQSLNPKVKCIGVRCELTNDQDVQTLVDKTVQEFGRIDIVVTNAVAMNLATISSPEYLSAFEETFALKVRSSQVLAKLVLPYLIENKGNFIHMSGNCSVIPHPKLPAVSMADCAMDMFIKCLAVELAPKGVRCNSVMPAMVRTPLFGPLIEKVVQYCEHYYPLRRICEPEEVANLVAFLASSNASYITGETIRIDGASLLASLPEFQD